MTPDSSPGTGRLAVAPYFDDLLDRLAAGDLGTRAAFGRHVHWGYWPDPDRATGAADDYAAAAERLCRAVCDAAGVADGMRVLDVGCGFGGTIASLNERFSDLDLVGVNIDPRQLDRARAEVRPLNGNRVRFVYGDACALDVPPASFDVVLAVECVFHFESRARFFDGAARALRPGGRLALSDFVPPRAALAELERHDPGADEATRVTYGRVDVLCPVERYRDLADAVGLALAANRDITAGTMPTYAFLQADLRARPDRRAARVYSRATSRLEIACRLGLLTYSVLSFVRRADAAARSA
jgi:cyclopropane fatty-acyl-phospholipid synthase-like methyltransferase